MLSSGHWSVTAIALYLVICIGVNVGISYFLVVFVDDRFHVVHTAVANFDVILVDVFTERRVVPDDISLSVALGSCRLFFFVVGQCFRIAAGFQS